MFGSSPHTDEAAAGAARPMAKADVKRIDLSIIKSPVIGYRSPLF
jgi:hypothetical protein